MEICGFYQQRIRNLNGRPESAGSADYYPQQFAEASAVLCQAAEVMGVWDGPIAARFLDNLLRPGNRYGAALARTITLFHQTPWAMVSAFLAWCMFGNYIHEDNAMPLRRFELLGAELHANAPRALPRRTPQNRREWLKLFDQWDSLTHQPSTVEGLQASALELRLSFERTRSRIRQHDLDELHAPFLDDIGQVVDARSHMVEAFIADPGAYLDPAAYRQNMDCWTAAPLKITFSSGHALGVTDDDAWNIYAQLGDEHDGKRAGTILGPREPLSGVRHIAPNSAFSVYSLTSVADVLIGPRPALLDEFDLSMAELLLGLPIRSIV
jgi:hypothetical protein